MNRGVKIAIAAAGALAMCAAGAIYWLFYDTPSAPAESFQLDLRELRRLVASSPGRGPEEIQIERLSHTMVPKIAIVAGTNWSKIDMVRASYRLVFPHRTILIDTANSAEFAKKSGAESYDTDAWRRLTSAMKEASAIVVTHEHRDHIGGLIEGPDRSQVWAKAVLTREQVADPRAALPLQWPDLSRTHFRPLDYQRFYALAPGVVLIKAPGHTPGSQMIYVRRADGHEFLFVGDTASLLDNVGLQRIRSRYVTDWNGGEPHDDRVAVMAQTVALHRLALKNPNLTIVAGHDGQQMENLIAQGLLVDRFSTR